MRLLREKYKTWDGAHKRAAFENGVAGSEFRNGIKAKLYRYAVVEDPDNARLLGQLWRVERRTAED